MAWGIEREGPDRFLERYAVTQAGEARLGWSTRCRTCASLGGLGRRKCGGVQEYHLYGSQGIQCMGRSVRLTRLEPREVSGSSWSVEGLYVEQKGSVADG